MRKVFILVTFALIVTCGKTTDRFSYQPSYPQASQEISVTYNAAGTSLEDANEIQLLAYCFSENTAEVVEVPMKKSGALWRSSFSFNDTTLSVYIVFSANGLIDDNEKTGYLISIFDKNQNPVRGGLASQAIISVHGSSYPFEFWNDPVQAKEYLEMEFEHHPEQKQNPDIQRLYWYTLRQLDKESAIPLIKPQLDMLDRKEDKSIKEVQLLAEWYGRVGEKEKSQKYQTTLATIVPDEIQIENRRYQECMEVSSIDKQYQLTTTFLREFPNSYKLERLHRSMLSAFNRTGRLEDAENYFNTFVENPSAQFLSSIARDMFKKDILPEKALSFAEHAVEKTRHEILAEEKDGYFSRQQWQKRQDKKLMRALLIYGDGLIKYGMKEKAIPIFEEAIKLDSWRDRKIAERYCQLLYDTGRYELAAVEVRKQLEYQPLNEELQTLLKKVLREQNQNEDGIESFLADAREQYRTELIKEIQSKLFTKTAPSFTLKDLGGNAVSLAEYKGKIVVLDFWATWCTWCIKGFPGMQKAVDKYDNVKFLFINTWEDTDVTDDRVQKFIETRNYSFHILRDRDGSVSRDFIVSGLPTKIIIDPKGNIRFRKVGFNNDSELLEELDLIIEMLR